MRAFGAELEIRASGARVRAKPLRGARVRGRARRAVGGLPARGRRDRGRPRARRGLSAGLAPDRPRRARGVRADGLPRRAQRRRASSSTRPSTACARVDVDMNDDPRRGARARGRLPLRGRPEHDPQHRAPAHQGERPPGRARDRAPQARRRARAGADVAPHRARPAPRRAHRDLRRPPDGDGRSRSPACACPASRSRTRPASPRRGPGTSRRSTRSSAAPPSGAPQLLGRAALEVAVRAVVELGLRDRGAAIGDAPFRTARAAVPLVVLLHGVEVQRVQTVRAGASAVRRSILDHGAQSMPASRAPQARARLTGPCAASASSIPAMLDQPGTPPRGVALEARGLARHFGAHRALDGLDLRIEPGEAFGLLGANGAGKTTFLRLVTGYLLPTAGSVTVDGISPARDAQAVARRLGFVAETTRLYPELRVRGFLRFVAGARGLAGALAERASPRASAASISKPVAQPADRPPLEGVPAAREPRAGLPPRSAAPPRRRADERPRSAPAGRGARRAARAARRAHAAPLHARPRRGARAHRARRGAPPRAARRRRADRRGARRGRSRSRSSAAEGRAA